MKKPHFELIKGKDAKFYFHLKDMNGEVILAGRGFTTKAEAIHAIASVMRYGVSDSRFVRKESTGGMFFFQLQSPSGRILGWSEMYHSKQGRDNGIVAVRRAVQYGRILDLN